MNLPGTIVVILLYNIRTILCILVDCWLEYCQGNAVQCQAAGGLRNYGMRRKPIVGDNSMVQCESPYMEWLNLLPIN